MDVKNMATKKYRSGGAWSETVVQRIYEHRNWKTLWFYYRIDSEWEHIIGRESRGIAAPKCIRNRVLWIRVGSSAHIHHLHMLKPGIIQRINELDSENAISDIRFALEPFSIQDDNTDPEPLKHAVSPAESQAFAEQTEAIADAHTRGALRRMWRLFQEYKGK